MMSLDTLLLDSSSGLNVKYLDIPALTETFLQIKISVAES
jgi:hypothetical protein